MAQFDLTSWMVQRVDEIEEDEEWEEEEYSDEEGEGE